MSPVDVLKAAANRGLTLRINGEKLRVLPAKRLAPDFAETLREHKPRLLSLLQLPFVMVFSETLEETVFFCPDDTTKAALCDAGAEPWSCGPSAKRTALLRFLLLNYARCMRSTHVLREDLIMSASVILR
jgi:hypothetical protein